MDREIARQVLRIESDAIAALIDRLDESFDRALDILQNCRGRVVTTGMGKSGIVCRKLAATFASTRTPALFLHPAEAVHGDLGMLSEEDVVIALSNSGETSEILRLLQTVKRLGIPLISMTGRLDSTLALESDLAFDVGVDREACTINLAPTASTTAALAWGDALAIALSQRKGLQVEDFAQLHPAGGLGQRLARVEELMHKGDAIPKVAPNAPMDQVIYEMSKKGLGVTSVCQEEGRLMGVISDGDLRRLLQDRRTEALDLSAGDAMTEGPVTIGPSEMVESALHKMEDRKITSLMVVDDGILLGVIHLHDLWRSEMF